MVEGKSLRSFRFFIFGEENFAVEIIGTTNHLWLKKEKLSEPRICTNIHECPSGFQWFNDYSCPFVSFVVKRNSHLRFYSWLKKEICGLKTSKFFQEKAVLKFKKGLIFFKKGLTFLRFALAYFHLVPTQAKQ